MKPMLPNRAQARPTYRTCARCSPRALPRRGRSRGLERESLLTFHVCIMMVPTVFTCTYAVVRMKTRTSSSCVTWARYTGMPRATVALACAIILLATLLDCLSRSYLLVRVCVYVCVLGSLNRIPCNGWTVVDKCSRWGAGDLLRIGLPHNEVMTGVAGLAHLSSLTILAVSPDFFRCRHVVCIC